MSGVSVFGRQHRIVFDMIPEETVQFLIPLPPNIYSFIYIYNGTRGLSQ